VQDGKEKKGQQFTLIEGQIIHSPEGTDDLSSHHDQQEQKQERSIDSGGPAKYNNAF
jgi:hypothetical protein